PIGATRGTPRTPFFEGCSPSPLAPSYASDAVVDVLGTEDVGAACASAKRRSSKGKGGTGGGGGSGSGGGGSSGGSGGSGGGGSGGTGGGSGGVGGGSGGSVGSGGSGRGGSGGGKTGAQRGGSGGGQRQRQQRRSETPSPQQLCEWLFKRGASGGSVSCPYVIRTSDRAGQTCGKPHTQHRCFSRLDDAWRAEFGDEVERPHWAELLSAEGDCYRCVSPDPGVEAAALGASESSLPGTVPAEALHTFTLDSGASRCFFHDSTTRTPLPAPVPIRLADPSLLRVFPSHNVMFDESVPFYRLFPYRSTPPPHSSLFLAPGPPPVDPLPPQGRAPSGVSQVDPLPGTVPVEVAGGSCAARGTASGGAESGGAEPGGAKSEGAGSGGAEPGGAELRGAEPTGVEPGGAEPVGVELGGAQFEGAKSRGAEPRGAALSGGPASASPRLSPWPEPLSPQQLREWLVRRARPWSGATGGGATGDTGAGGAGVIAGAGGTGGTAAAGPGGACTRGTGAARTGGVGGSGVGDPTEPGAAGAGGTRAGGIGAEGARAGGAGAGGTGAGGAGAGGAGAEGTGAGGAGARGAGVFYSGAGGAGVTGVGGTMRPLPYFVPLLQQVLGVPSSTILTPPLLCPPPDQSQPPLQLASPLPAPSPYTEQSGGLTQRCAPASHPVWPVRTARRVPRSRPPPVLGTHAMALRPSSIPLRVPLPPPPASSLPAVPDPESGLACAASLTVSRLLATFVTDPSFESNDFESTSPPFVRGECALGMDVLEDRQEDFECLAAAVPHFASMLLALEGDPDAPNIPTPRSCAEAITVPPSRANIVDGMWIFRVKRPPGSPPAFKARYVARGFSQRQRVDDFHTFSPTPKMTTLWVLLHVAAQRDYELHSLHFSTTFLQGSLDEEIYLHHPPGITGSFPTGTQWSLRQPVSGLCQARRQWHDTQRTTLAAPGFTPSTADPSLFLRTDTSLPPFYIFIYVDDLVFATTDTEPLTLVMSDLQKRHTCTNIGELRSYHGLQITRDRARRTITLT
ncbi:unnamed protein product, partial [Closterium sp. NIES-54]